MRSSGGSRIAGAFGLLVAGLLAWYLSRRDRHARARALARGRRGRRAANYAVEIPEGGAGEIGHLAERFERDDRAARRGRGARAQLPHVGLARAAHAADRDPRPRRGAARGRRRGSRAARRTRSRSSRPRRAGSSGSSATSSTSRSSTRTASRCVREEVDMEQLVEQAYETFSDEARRRSIDYRVDVSARPVIVSDGDRVLQIVGNLLSNAFRATPDGGRITLELSAANGHDQRRGRGHGARDPAREARAALPRRSSRRRGGTGLGLAIAKELSGALGGRIDLDSEVGRGSRFELRAAARGGRPAFLPELPRADRRLGRAQLDDRRAARAVERALDPVEALVQRAPLAGDQVDEEREVVDARVPLGQQVASRAARGGGSSGSRAPSPRRAGARSAPPPRAGRRAARCRRRRGARPGARPRSARAPRPGAAPARAPRRSSGGERVAIVHGRRRGR